MTGGISINLDADSLRPLVALVASELLDRIQVNQPTDQPEKIAFSEVEAAKMIGLSGRQLGDERRRGRIECFRVVGGGIRYSRQHLLDYLARPKPD